MQWRCSGCGLVLDSWERRALYQRQVAKQPVGRIDPRFHELVRIPQGNIYVCGQWVAYMHYLDLIAPVEEFLEDCFP
jgi:hypothetical protein